MEHILCMRSLLNDTLTSSLVNGIHTPGFCVLCIGVEYILLCYAASHNATPLCYMHERKIPKIQTNIKKEESTCLKSHTHTHRTPFTKVWLLADFVSVPLRLCDVLWIPLRPLKFHAIHVNFAFSRMSESKLSKSDDDIYWANTNIPLDHFWAECSVPAKRRRRWWRRKTRNLFPRIFASFTKCSMSNEYLSHAFVCLFPSLNFCNYLLRGLPGVGRLKIDKHFERFSTTYINVDDTPQKSAAPPETMGYAWTNRQ